MSYILDALRKSEQQRQRGATPSLGNAPAAAEAAPPRRRGTLGYLLLAAAFVGIGLTIGVLRPWSADQPAPSPVATKPPEAVVVPPVANKLPETVVAPPVANKLPEAVVAPPVANKLPEAVVAPSVANKLPEAAVVAPPVAARTPVLVAADKAPKALPPGSPAVPATTPVPSAAPAPAVSVAPVAPPAPVAAPASAPAPAPAPTPERPAVTIAELPVALQQELPKLAILFHLYSANPKDRMVGINNRTFREGGSVEPGLVLEQITPDGMILSYKGYRFVHGPR